MDRAAECCFPSERASERVYNRIKVRKEERWSAKSSAEEEESAKTEMELRRMDQQQHRMPLQEHMVRRVSAKAPSGTLFLRYVYNLCRF